MALFSRNLITGIVDRIAALTEEIFVVVAQGTNFYTRITETNDSDLEIGGTPPGLESAFAVDTKLSSDTILDTEFTEILQWIDSTVTTVPPTPGGTAFTSFDHYLTTNGIRVHETFKNIFNRTITTTANQVTAANTFPRQVLLGTIAFSSSSAVDFTDGSAVNTNNTGPTQVGAELETPVNSFEIRLAMADGLSGQTTERLVVEGDLVPSDTDDLLTLSASATYQELSFTSCIALDGFNIPAGAASISLVATAGLSLSPPLNAQALNVLDSNGNSLFQVGDRVIIRDNTSVSPFEVYTVQSAVFTTPTLALTFDRNLDSTFLNANAPSLIRVEAFEEEIDGFTELIGFSSSLAFVDDVLTNSLNIFLNASTAGSLDGKLPEINTLNDSNDILFKPNMKVLIRDETDVSASNVNQEINCILSATITAAGDQIRLTLENPTKNAYSRTNNCSIQRLYTDVATVQSSATGVSGQTARFVNVPDREVLP